MSAIESLFNRIEARAAAIVDDGPDSDAGGLRGALAELREDLHLTPTFLDTRREAHTEMLATVAEFHAASALYADAEDTLWRDFFVAEYRPQITRALQDLAAAQIREHLELVIPRLRALRSQLAGLRAQRGDYT